MREQILDIALQPRPSCSAGEVQGGVKEAAAQRELDVAAQVGAFSRNAQLLAGSDPVEERPGRPAELLTHRHWVHGHVHEPAGGRPDLVLELCAYRAGDEEAIGVGGCFDRTPDGTEHVRNALPLVEQYGLRKTPERGIGVGLKRRRP